MFGGAVIGYVWVAAYVRTLAKRVCGQMCPQIADPETCLGKTDRRIEVPIVNERQRQIDNGALNYRPG